MYLQTMACKGGKCKPSIVRLLKTCKRVSNALMSVEQPMPKSYENTRLKRSTSLKTEYEHEPTVAHTNNRIGITKLCKPAFLSANLQLGFLRVISEDSPGTKRAYFCFIHAHVTICEVTNVRD